MKVLAAAEQQDDPQRVKAVRKEFLEHDQERTTEGSIVETPADKKRPEGVENDR